MEITHRCTKAFLEKFREIFFLQKKCQKIGFAGGKTENNFLDFLINLGRFYENALVRVLFIKFSLTHLSLHESSKTGWGWMKSNEKHNTSHTRPPQDF